MKKTIILLLVFMIIPTLAIAQKYRYPNNYVDPRVRKHYTNPPRQYDDPGSTAGWADDGAGGESR